MDSPKIASGKNENSHSEVDVHAIQVFSSPSTPTSNTSSPCGKMMGIWYKIGPRGRVLLVEAFLLSLAFTIVIPWYASEVISNSRPDGNLVAYYPNPLSSSGIMAEFVVNAIDPLTLTASTQIYVKACGNFSLSKYTEDEADEGILFFNFLTFQEVLVPYLKSAKISDIGKIEEQNATLTLTISEIGMINLCCGPNSQREGSISEFYKTFSLKAIKGPALYPLDQYGLKIYVRLLMTVNGEFIDQSGSYLTTLYFSFPLDVTFYESAADFAASGSITLRNSTRNETIAGDLDTLYRSTSIDVTFSRGPSIVGISFFIVAMMWLLTVGVFYIAIDEYFIRPIDMDMNPTKVVISTGLLFALPSLRAVQPGVPPLVVYSGTDILGFYLPMALIALSGFMMMNKLVWLYQPKRRN